ncbi:glycerol-3-phosphate 2-O-acyltransferase 6 [Sorghum bicolor]|jgi:glycerol-3-phosphate acyltransferase|uniref:Phospholipid/glycerol acyltransferase domain-containing protein n=1 Tax=Sorghum bicolor TaxID=4558 RepID=Q8W0S3_SORBI|nr:glycerol-3-phosphate 2-O-acyltransferase 6 [Sorghum bicolor]AAL73535.1 hypothetical protein SBl8C08.18 [Sorghum bicolor]|eukprot:XP_002445007.1 glycerol-3-phosphate 2-O-acyltransferase 6 [Sorghum bicolor]
MAAASHHRCTSVASELEGTLLISGSLFPYFFLVALEAGGPLRALLLLAAYPLVALLGAAFSSDDLPLLAMTFLSTAGLGVADVTAVARATLPKFFLADLRGTAFRALARHGDAASGGERYVVTRLPRLVVEPFVREYLGADVRVVGTELRVVAGSRFSGTLVASPGVVGGGDRSLGALVAVLGRDRIVDVGLYCSASGGDRQPAFLQVCQERRVVSAPEKAPATPLPRSEYLRPLVFHDGRLVCRPDPLVCLAIFLWIPLGVLLSVARLLFGFFPHGAGLLLAAATGFRIRGSLGGAAEPAGPGRGTLFACNHQTLMDPVILSTVLRRKVTAVTYSLSSFSELIAPIPTVRLTRDRGRDSRIMQGELTRGDLVVCPEGTTCREPYLLRFSPLFAEIAGEVTPTAVRAGGTMFHGSTVRGHKWLDSVFFLMNPAPWYEIRILTPVATCGSGGGASSLDVANGVQRVIGDALGFECTGLTRRDKYRMIAGHDGVDARSSPPKPPPS